MAPFTRSASRHRPKRRWRIKNGLMVPTGEAVAEAMASVPHEAPWAWAALRVLPALRGERVETISDDDLEEIGFRPTSDFPRLTMPPGVEVSMVIEVDVVTISVDQQQLDRWEMTLQEVVPAAMANLRRVIGTWDGAAYDDVFDGTPVRALSGWPQWASSLLLLPDELMRIFGPHDQLFVAPYACNLMSLPSNVDLDVAADLVDMFGILNPGSLLLGMPAFVLRDGELTLEDLPGFADDPFDGQAPVPLESLR